MRQGVVGPNGSCQRGPVLCASLVSQAAGADLGPVVLTPTRHPTPGISAGESWELTSLDIVVRFLRYLKDGTEPATHGPLLRRATLHA